MKICFVTSSFPRAAQDHAAPWLAESAQQLKARGNSVSVFAPSYMGRRQEGHPGTEVWRFRYAPAAYERLTHEDSSPENLRRGIFWRLVLLSYVITGSLNAILYFTRRRFDVIDVHWPFPQAIFAVIGKLLTGSRLVFHFYASEILLIKDSLALKLALRFLLLFSDRIIAISTYTKELLITELGVKQPIDVIPFGQSFDSPANDAAAGGPPGTGNPLNLLYVGKLIERKGPLYLVEAMKLLKEMEVFANLRMVGDGYMRAEVLSRIAATGTGDTITLLGFISKDDLTKEFRNCHILVFPSIIDSRGDTEGQGLAPLDALIHCKPAIASAVGGVTDLIKDGETGFLVPQKDAEAIARKVLYIKENYLAALKIAENGRRYAIANFSWESVTDKTLKVYHA